MTQQEIWRTASLLVRRHGSTAPGRAEQRASEFIDRDDPEGWATWVWIEKAARELLRDRPRVGELLN